MCYNGRDVIAASSGCIVHSACVYMCVHMHVAARVTYMCVHMHVAARVTLLVGVVVLPCGTILGTIR